VTGVPAYIARISAGATSPRSWAPNGSVWSRGSDDNGQVQVTGLTIAAQIAAGGASSFAARTVAHLLGS
jgi:hypothetical protein